MHLPDLKGQTILVAVSGGLDSCTITHWLTAHGVDVVAYTAKGETRPREVVFFQMATLGADVGGCDEVTSLAGLREVMGIPKPKVLNEALQASRLRALVSDGMSVKAAAAEVGVSRATAFRRLKNRCIDYITLFETAAPAGGDAS